MFGVASWIFNVPLLTSIVSGYVPTSLRAALGYVLIGLVLTVRTAQGTDVRLRKLALGAATTVVVLGMVSLGEFFTGTYLPIEQSLLRHRLGASTSFMIQVSPISAFCFVAAGASLVWLILDRPKRWVQHAPALAVLVAATNFVVLLGYLYGTPLLYGGTIRPVGLLSATTSFVLAIGIVAGAGVEAFPLRRLVGPSVQARMLRTFLPVTFLVVLSGELVSDFYRSLPNSNPALQNALQTVVSAVLVTLAISRVAGVIGADLDRAEAGRQTAEAELRRAHDELEARVFQRTEDLAKANGRLQESEAKNRALLSAIPDWIFRIRRDRSILDFKAPKDDSRLPGETANGRRPESEGLLPYVLEHSKHHLDRAFHTGEPQTFEFQFPAQDDVREFEARLVCSGTDEVIGIMRDITDRKRLEKEIVEISGREHARIGQDLHDGLGQHLTGVAFMAKVLEETLAEKNLAEASQAVEIRRSVSQAIGWTRKLSRGLVHLELETTGLAASLSELVNEVSRTFKIECVAHCPNQVPVNDHETALHLYRIAQEATNNAIKHGKASEIVIRLTVENERWLRLTIEDNGLGFPEKLSASRGMGLRIMQYRARAIGGTLELRRRPEGGSRVSCSVLASA